MSTKSRHRDSYRSGEQRNAAKAGVSMARMKTSKTFSFLCLFAGAALSASAADGIKHRDKEFLEDAAKSGMAEVSISQVALARSANPQVKEFAQMMVSDHSGANTQVMALAAEKGVTLPADKTDVEKWQKRDAKDFDQEYIDKMIADHKHAVDLFEKESKNGDDPALKSFAQKTLPTLMAHLDKAKELKKMVK